jgi:hypothetical protein
MRQLEEKLGAAHWYPPEPGSPETEFLETEVEQVRARVMEREAELTALVESTSTGRVSAVGHRLARIDATGFSDVARQALMSRLPVHVGDTLSEESIEQIGAALREFDRHLGFGVGWRLVEVDGGDIALRIVAPNPR